MTKEKAALVWHIADLVLAGIGVTWSIYHLLRKRRQLVDLPIWYRD